MLPLDGQCFVDKRTGKDIELNIWNAETWVKYGLTPVLEQQQQEHGVNVGASTGEQSGTVSSSSTYSRKDKLVYLQRTLTETLAFKHSLQHQSNTTYPSFSLLYCAEIPTVVGAKVDGIDGLRRGDWYDDLILAAGDGVVSARAVSMPAGFVPTVKVRSTRGHVGLLADIEGVAKCLKGVMVRDEGKSSHDMGG